MEIPENHPRCNEKLIVSFCMECNEPITELDRFIMETRDETEYVLSHGLHKICKEKALLEFRLQRIEALGLPRKK